MTVNQAGDVGFGLAGHQMWRAELFQHTIVFILIDHPLVVDPGGIPKAEKKQTKLLYTGLVFPKHGLLFFAEGTTADFAPHVLIPTADSKVLRLSWIDKDGVESHLFVAFLDNHQFAAAQMFRGTKGQKDKPW